MASGIWVSLRRPCKGDTGPGLRGREGLGPGQVFPRTLQCQEDGTRPPSDRLSVTPTHGTLCQAH